MEKIICSNCGDERHTASPQIFVGDIHIGCGGHYQYTEKNKGCQGFCIYKAPLSLKGENPKTVWCAKNGAWMLFIDTPCADKKGW